MAARLWQSQEGSTAGVCDCFTRPASAFGGCGGFKRLRHATDPDDDDDDGDDGDDDDNGDDGVEKKSKI